MLLSPRSTAHVHNLYSCAVVSTHLEVTLPTLHLTGDGYDGGDHCWPVAQSLCIGREHADITIALPNVSRRHAQVTNIGGRCHISDLNSKNGTAVNGVHLEHGPCWLRHGDTITLAGVAELNYVDPNATPFTPRLGRLKGLWIDPASQDVWIDAQRLNPPLSSRQQLLLQTLVDAEGRLVSREEIISTLWPGHNAEAVSNDAVDSLIKRLRQRVNGLSQEKSLIQVLRGRGIRLANPGKIQP